MIMPAVTNTDVDNMDDTTFTTVPWHMSPLAAVTGRELVVVDPVTNLEVVDDLIDVVLESAWGMGFFPNCLHKKVSMAADWEAIEGTIKKQKIIQIESERAYAYAQFTSKAKAMVTQQFALPSYPPHVHVAGFVELLCFMFLGYNWEFDNLVGFNRTLVEYKDLSPYKGNYMMWFDAKFCAAYGAWTFYDKVTISCHVLHFRKRAHYALKRTPYMLHIVHSFVSLHVVCETMTLPVYNGCPHFGPW